MIKITKEQRDYLLKKNKEGAKIYPEDIHHTHGHHKKYYVTTTVWVLDALYQFEQEKIISTRT